MPTSKRFFALFGAKQSGKTSYLASLYGSGGVADGRGPAYHVSANESLDDPTHSYLGRILRVMRSGNWPDNTPFDRLKLMTIHFTTGDLSRELVLPDVGGELTLRDGQLQSDLKEEILATYQDYQGFLIFVPADVTDPKRAAESKWEVDTLLNALRQRVPEGRAKIARPFAVLVTKWDLIEPGPLNAGSEARAGAFLDEIHPEQASGLRTLCENFRVFPVSATGPLVAGRPPVPLRPTDLAEPIAWLVETSERVSLERAIAYVDRNQEKLFRGDPGDERRRTFLTVARERLETFLEDVPTGPLADEARARLKGLRALHLGRLKRHAAVGTLIATFIAVAAVGRRDHIAYRKAHDLLGGSSSGLSRREVVARVGTVARGPFWSHPVGHLLWWRGLRRDLASYRADYEERAYKELERRSPPNDEKSARTLLEKIVNYEADFPDSPRFAKLADLRVTAEGVARSGEENRFRARIDEDYRQFSARPDDPGLAKRLQDECEAFLKALPRSIHVATVQSIRAEAQAVVGTITRARNYEELQHNLSKAAESPLRCHQLCAEFLKNDPSHPRSKEVSDERDRFLRKADDRAWGEVIGFARGYPSLFREQIAKCGIYTDNSLFKSHQKEANEFRTRAIRGYDRTAYEAIRTRAGDNNHPATLLAVRKLCSDYLNSTVSTKAMSSDVERWAAWFDEWGKGREFHVRVASVRIERNSDWHHAYSYYDPWVHAGVQIGPRAESTGDKSIPLGRDERDLPSDQLGPFTWKWGDPEVLISVHHKGGKPAAYVAKFGDPDPFKVRYLNGPTTFDDGKIAVRLECPIVIPPSLPPYKD